MRPLFALLVFVPVLVHAADNRCPLGTPEHPAADDEDCAAIRIVIAPSRPEALEPVYLRLHGVDPDHTAIDTASIRHAGGAESGAVDIVVRLSSVNPRFVVVDPDAISEFSIGSLPRGTYRIHATISSGPDGGGGLGIPPPSFGFAPPALEFDVVGKRQEPNPFQSDLVGPPGASSIVYNYRQAVVDYSGMWYTPSESGSGLSIEHVLRTDALVAVWNVHDEERQPRWYMFGPGEWLSNTAYRAVIYRTRGSPVGDPYHAADRTAEPVGEGTLSFDSIGSGELDFVVEGERILKPIAKLIPAPPEFAD